DAPAGTATPGTVEGGVAGQRAVRESKLVRVRPDAPPLPRLGKVSNPARRHVAGNGAPVDHARIVTVEDAAAEGRPAETVRAAAPGGLVVGARALGEGEGAITGDAAAVGTAPAQVPAGAALNLVVGDRAFGEREGAEVGDAAPPGLPPEKPVGPAVE